jgi:hypothetical protein
MLDWSLDNASDGEGVPLCFVSLTQIHTLMKSFLPTSAVLLILADSSS